jgi:galactonate dehydratase
VLYRGGFYRGGAILMSAIAGIDQALWDIKGKALGVPVYQLLGGRVRERMKTYRWVGGDRPADIVAQMQRYQAQGFDTFKFNGTEELKLIDSPRAIDAAVAKVAAIRDAMGDRVDFGIDFHGRVSAPMARVLLRELAPFKPLFVEEPVLPEQWEYYRPLSDATSIPLAAGERMYSRAEFKPVLAAGGLAILQPDLSHAGGITECVKIAAMAEAHDVALAPHCPLGPVALAACLQVDFVSHNAMLQEQSIGIHYNTGADLLDYVLNKEDFRCDGTGSIAALPKPGLGVEIDEDRLLEAHRQPPRWRNPLWRHADGSVAEW